MELLNLKKNNFNISRNNNILIVFSHIININIELLWIFLKDLLISIDKSTKNFQFIKGDNTWKIGNIFSYYWANLYKVKSETIDIIEENERKKISWKIETDFGFNYIKTCYLYKISQKEQTLLKIIIIPEQNIPSNLLSSPNNKFFFLFNPYTLLDKDKYRKEEKEKIISYESCIINENYKDIWNFMTDFKKLSEIGPIIGTNIEKWGSTYEVGTFWKTYIKSQNKTIFLRVNKVKMNEKKSIWIYSLETIGTDQSIIPHQIDLKVSKINEKKCQLSITHTFLKKISNNTLKIYIINKRDILKRVKRYFENKNLLNKNDKYKYTNIHNSFVDNIENVNNSKETINSNFCKKEKIKNY